MKTDKVRLRNVCRVNPPLPGFSDLADDTPLTFLPLEAVWPGERFDASRTRPKSAVESGYTRILEGDVLVPKITPTFEAGRSVVARGLLNGMACGSTELHVLRAGPLIDRDFLALVTTSHSFLDGGTGAMSGVAGQQRVPDRFVRDFRLTLPDLAVQRRVVAHTSSRVHEIDQAIDSKRRLMRLLLERRHILVSDTVFAAAGAAKASKPSGIPWLPLIPEHWEIRRLKFAADLQSGITLGADYGDAMLAERPYLRVANVQDGWLDLSSVTTIAIPVADVARYELHRGDVLVTEGGDFDKLGRGTVWDGEIDGCLHQNHIFAIRPHRELLEPRFLGVMMSSAHGRAYFTRTAQQTTNLASTNSTTVMNMPLPLPPVDEQRRILTTLAARTGVIDALLERLEGQIGRLAELRRIVITQAVEGHALSEVAA